MFYLSTERYPIKQTIKLKLFLWFFIVLQSEEEKRNKEIIKDKIVNVNQRNKNFFKSSFYYWIMIHVYNNLYVAFAVANLMRIWFRKQHFVTMRFNMTTNDPDECHDQSSFSISDIFHDQSFKSFNSCNALI